MKSLFLQEAELFLKINNIYVYTILLILLKANIFRVKNLIDLFYESDVSLSEHAVLVIDFI
jgi:hypothetical protein